MTPAICPATLPAPLLAVVLACPDAALSLWISSTSDAQLARRTVEALSPRERAHAARILVSRAPVTVDQRRRRRSRSAESDAIAACAEYVRERLISGDHVAQAKRLGLDVAAVINLDGHRYVVTARNRQSATLRGQRGGIVTLLEPLTDGGRWSAWFGGIGALHAKLRRYQRTDGGEFVAVAS